MSTLRFENASVRGMRPALVCFFLPGWGPPSQCAVFASSALRFDTAWSLQARSLRVTYLFLVISSPMSSVDSPQFYNPDKAMPPHSSTLAWKIPWSAEPGRLQSMGLQRVGHDWVTSLSLFTFMHWRRKWQLTPVFLRGESQGWGSLVGCRLWCRTESDMIKAT